MRCLHSLFRRESQSIRRARSGARGVCRDWLAGRIKVESRYSWRQTVRPPGEDLEYDDGQAGPDRGRLAFGTGDPEPHARAARPCGGHRRVGGAGARIPAPAPPGRDLHGSPHAGHGRLPGGPGHQGRAADRHHPPHDVHLAGRRAVREPGACARCGRRAAEDRAPGGRVARARTSCTCCRTAGSSARAVRCRGGRCPGGRGRRRSR